MRGRQLTIAQLEPCAFSPMRAASEVASLARLACRHEILDEVVAFALFGGEDHGP